MITAQEILNTVYQKLTEQQQACLLGVAGNSPTCVHFHENGNKCAVGHLLPDSPRVREWMISTELNANIGVIDMLQFLQASEDVPDELHQWRLLMDPHRRLLLDLQRIHDQNGMEYATWNQTQFDKRIAVLCYEYDLEFPETQESEDE